MTCLMRVYSSRAHADRSFSDPDSPKPPYGVSDSNGRWSLTQTHPKFSSRVARSATPTLRDSCEAVSATDPRGASDIPSSATGWKATHRRAQSTADPEPRWLERLGTHGVEERLRLPPALRRPKLMLQPIWPRTTSTAPALTPHPEIVGGRMRQRRQSCFPPLRRRARGQESEDVHHVGKIGQQACRQSVSVHVLPRM